VSVRTVAGARAPEQSVGHGVIGASVLAPALVAVPVVALAAASGGGYPTAWNLLAIGMGAVALVLTCANARIGRVTLTAAGLLAALTALSAISYAWSVDGPATAAEVQRWMALTATFAGLSLVAGRWGVHTLGRGCAAAATAVCIYALGTRLAPQWLGTAHHGINRLYEPIGYWNALGQLAALGLVLCVGLAAEGRLTRTLTAGSAVPLAATLYLTFSRGSVLALLVGAGILIALEWGDRVEAAIRVALTAAPGVVSIGVIHAFPTLTQAFPDRSAQIREGRIAILLLCAIAGVAMAVAWRGSGGSLLTDARRRHHAAVALILLGVLTLVAGIASIGGPGGLVRLVATSGESAPHFKGGDLNLRLLSLSPNGRSDIWRVAWHDLEAHPLLGSGDGSFGEQWLRHRSEPDPAVAAHNLYLETAAELGIAGLVLLVAFLTTAFAAARRARGAPMVAAFTGALGGAVVQQAFDWTWDVTAVTVIVIACAAALTSAADLAAAPVPSRRWWLASAAAIVVGLASICLAGNVALGRAYDALAAEQFAVARSRASLAAELAPWSSTPWQIAAYADGKLDNATRARSDARRGLEVAPHDWWFRFKLACLDRGQNRAVNLAAMRAMNPLAPELRGFPVRCGEPLGAA
jgi:O-antigen ligase